MPPLIIGTYYGKQECRTSKDEIEREMMLLNEEITEKKKDGPIVLTMDGNGKIGLMNEEISRNGKELLKVFDETNLTVLNRSDICTGKITRQNKKGDEKSAIDFVTASSEICKWFEKMTIDEEGLMRVKGKNESDHNTIVFHMNIPSINRIGAIKKTTWNIHASDEKWKDFSHELEKRKQKAATIITNTEGPLEAKMKKYMK